MFTLIEDYIKLSQTERQQHLDLSASCIEIGGKDTREYRALLAHFLKTTIPTGMKIYLCHACHNSKCSNPVHLYWGLPKENLTDAFVSGANIDIGQRMRLKYSPEELSEIKKGNRTKKIGSLSEDYRAFV